MIKKKVLFLGHEASRTGAPLLLLEIIRWLGENSTLEAAIYLKRGGAIEKDYAKLAPTFSPRGKSQSMFRKVFRRLHIIGDHEPNLACIYPLKDYPVIYANTIDTCQQAMHLAGRGRRIIHHIHEMSYVTDLYQSTDLLRRAEPYTSIYVAASGAVMDFLINIIHVPPTKIQVIHEFPIAGCLRQHCGENRETIRSRHGIPEDAFVIGMCGSPCWRKGVDVFISLVQKVREFHEGKRCHFIWLGGEKGNYRESQYDVDKLGFSGCCHFVAGLDRPDAYFEAFDLFALTSREDPFPVVMLEAAARGVPIVCFDKSGGAPELVESDAGIIVPYLDVQAMARACVDLMLDREMLRRFGNQAKWKVENLYLLEQQGPKIRSVIQSAFELDRGL